MEISKMSWVLLIIFGSVMAKHGELGEEPDYYPKINPNPNNIEELTVQDIPMYFDMFNRFYEIDYKNNEHFNRSYEKFTDNVKRIIIMNKFSTPAKFAINEFSHLTLEEFTDKYTGFNDTGMNNSDATPFTYNSTEDAPANLDWRTLGMPALVRHQGPCKSSYVFSTIAYIESQMAKIFKVTIKLSEQQAYDCEKTGSCKNGGLPHKVMEALMDLGGIEKQTSYVYDPQDQRECKAKENLMVVRIKTVQYYLPIYENSLIALLAMYGPVVTTIYVSESVKNYHKGVLWPTDCDKKPNHAVLLVGYGITDDSIPYWIIKNSWGVLWGESGYIRLIRGERACNIGQYVAIATVEPIEKNKAAVRTQTDPPLAGFLNNVAGALFSLIPAAATLSAIDQSSSDTTTTEIIKFSNTKSTQPKPYYEEVELTESTNSKVKKYKAKKEKIPKSFYEEIDLIVSTTKKFKKNKEIEDIFDDDSKSVSKHDDDHVKGDSYIKPIARKRPKLLSSISSLSSSSSEGHLKYSKKVKAPHASQQENDSEEEDKSDSDILDSDDVARTKRISRVTKV